MTKQAQTRIGVVIAGAKKEMKAAGGFDNAVGTFEKAIRYLKPLQNQLTVPMGTHWLEATLEVQSDPRWEAEASQFHHGEIR